MEDKKRHGCLTAWLVLLIIWNVGFLSLMALGALLLRHTDQAMPLHLAVVYGGLGVANLLCIVGIFRWRKAAFEGLVAFNVIAAGLNLIRGRILFALGSLVPAIILWLVLYVVDRELGWDQLI